MSSGNEAVIEFERWLDDRRRALLAEIAAYNEEDCLATLELRDWLLEQRAEAEARVRRRDPVPAAARGARADGGADEALTETDAAARRAARRRRTEGDERWLAAQLLDYHRREARPAGGGTSAGSR